ncbi:MAG TPA: ScyD/ScyE family protein [Thermoanaerobaculia bacterium]|nr:ScyD/ScyE family protein [Thermoanaerobaculia bacterium]
MCLVGLFAAAGAGAQEILTAGTDFPLKLTRTPGGNLLLAESGTGDNDGRVSLLSMWGDRFTLLAGLPSAINVEGGGEPNGPSGVAQAHTTLYVVLGSGDAIGAVAPPRAIPNPDGPSSPLFSSLLRARFDPVPDGIREGFELGAAQLRQLADGLDVEIENDSGERVELSLLFDYRDLERDPITGVRPANPFAAAVAGSLTPADLAELGFVSLPLADANFLARLAPRSPLGRRLEERSSVYLVDASANTVNRVDPVSGRSRVIARIPPLPNPLFPNLGGPVVDPVPTSVRVRSDGSLLVSLLSGFPFGTGVAQVLRVDPATGAVTPFITGLTTATDVIEVGGAIYVLEFSTNFLARAPGRILRFTAPDAQPTVLVGGLISPAGMEYDPTSGALFVSETFTGRIVRVPLQP